MYLHQKIHHGGQEELQNFSHDLEDDGELRVVYDANRSHILADHKGRKGVNTYNFPVKNLSQDRNEIKEHLNKIVKIEGSAFKINLALGVILKNVQTNKYRYFIAYHNEMIFDSPHIVSTQASLDRLIELLQSLDIEEIALRSRQDTK